VSDADSARPDPQGGATPALVRRFDALDLLDLRAPELDKRIAAGTLRTHEQQGSRAIWLETADVLRERDARREQRRAPKRARAVAEALEADLVRALRMVYVTDRASERSFKAFGATRVSAERWRWMSPLKSRERGAVPSVRTMHAEYGRWKLALPADVKLPVHAEYKRLAALGLLELRGHGFSFELRLTALGRAVARALW
jgi:hypothetical protein